MGVFADGDVMWCLENVAGAPFNVYLIDKSNGSLIKQFSYSSFAYAMDINRIGPNLWISSFYPTPERVIVLDATGSYVKEIYPSIGGRIRGMDWVGDTIFYYVNNVATNNVTFHTMDTLGNVYKTYTGSGICGMAAERRETFVIQDVSKGKNYLACSPDVKSEIVVPVFKDGEIVAEIDIDSHTTAPFTDEDKEFLEDLSQKVSGLFE